MFRLCVECVIDRDPGRNNGRYLLHHFSPKDTIFLNDKL